MEISKAILDEMDLRKITRPHLKGLRDTIKETFHLMLLDDSMGVYIRSLKSPQVTIVASALGTKACLNYTLGKAKSAYLGDNEFERIVNTAGLQRMTNNTIDFTKLKKELSIIRTRVYSVDNKEEEIGTRCIGAPIFKHNGKVNASISLASPLNRLSEKKFKQYIPLIIEKAKNISGKLGYIK